ncbi:hypothetical protein RBG61_01435 [Paludicola sp. MB14-C6]|uniref:zonular occludens toxin domain-containing protein n=1 Tax=Paludihabitans sp. MB14-C6 TaxID=3070656 RepID=UPI0027DCDF04|nr:zonular occludens toxin domain-containing protein [Paludicola sp. MB14-C6]WMJ23352.1 hypothetical protein RBG61_01435 [Paludicola sp. MB14-C6]
MSIFVYLGVFIQKIFLLPYFLYFIIKDYIKWISVKGWKIFEGWGLHIYVGRFGAGKTSTMIHDAFNIANKYPQVTILTNLKLTNFPCHTQILSLRSPQDILNAPNNTLVVIDEIGTIFNSRDFAKSKESIPKILFQHLCQCRKRRLMIFATSQKWNFVDKQLRDITATVRATKMSFKHPFSRLATVYTYDAYEYDLAYSNPLLPLTPLNGTAYVQTDSIRNLYDTSELIENMLNSEYISDEEILQNQGYELSTNEITKVGKKAYKHSKNRL